MLISDKSTSLFLLNRGDTIKLGGVVPMKAQGEYQGMQR